MNMQKQKEADVYQKNTPQNDLKLNGNALRGISGKQIILMLLAERDGVRYAREKNLTH